MGEFRQITSAITEATNQRQKKVANSRFQRAMISQKFNSSLLPELLSPFVREEHLEADFIVKLQRFNCQYSREIISLGAANLAMPMP